MILTLTFSELCLTIFGRDKAIQQDDALVRGRNSLILAIQQQPAFIRQVFWLYSNVLHLCVEV